jgi:hypothetical protein
MNHGNGTEGQSAMSGGQTVHIVSFPVGGRITMKARSVPGGDSAFDESDRISGKTVDVWRSGRTALEGQTCKQENAAE